MVRLRLNHGSIDVGPWFEMQSAKTNDTKAIGETQETKGWQHEDKGGWQHEDKGDEDGLPQSTNGPRATNPRPAKKHELHFFQGPRARIYFFFLIFVARFASRTL